MSRDVAEAYGVTTSVKAKRDDSVNGPLSAVIRVDGCVHLRRYYNGTTPEQDDRDETDYIHICDLAAFIKELTELRDFALANLWEGEDP